MSENALRELLDDAVAEPLHVISPTAIRQIGRSRRRARRMMAGAGAAIAVVAAIVVPYLVVQPPNAAPIAQASQPAEPGLCASAPPYSAAEPMPAMLKVDAIVRCTTQIVRRPGQGIWLQRWEQRSKDGASLYAEALQPPSRGLECKTHMVVVPGPSRPNLVLDTSGRLRRIAIPDVCPNGKPAIQLVSGSLVWHTVATIWLVRVLPEDEVDSACARKWLRDSDIGDQLGMSATRVSMDAFCIVRPSPPSGPSADGFITATKLTGSAADGVRTALSGLPGVVSLHFTDRGKECTAPAKNVWLLAVDGNTVGYAGFDDCARGVDADLHTSADLQQLVAHLGDLG